MNAKTLLYQITETSKFMMSFVVVTKNDNVIVIDGGRSEDMPLLKEYVGCRHISAWIANTNLNRTRQKRRKSALFLENSLAKSALSFTRFQKISSNFHRFW